jgi:hypothetical protein
MGYLTARFRKWALHQNGARESATLFIRNSVLSGEKEKSARSP